MPIRFLARAGERYANVSSRFAAIRSRAGRTVKPFRFHDLRHWFAVDYLRRGGSIYDLQKILGHSSIRTTENLSGVPDAGRAATEQEGGMSVRTGAKVGTVATVRTAHLGANPDAFSLKWRRGWDSNPRYGC